MFQKLDLFLPSDEGRETPTLLGPLERLDQWLKLALSEGPNKDSPSTHLKMETDPVPTTQCFLVI
jgi:hypothetical protein